MSSGVHRLGPMHLDPVEVGLAAYNQASTGGAELVRRLSAELIAMADAETLNAAREWLLLSQDRQPEARTNDALGVLTEALRRVEER